MPVRHCTTMLAVRNLPLGLIQQLCKAHGMIPPPQPLQLFVRAHLRNPTILNHQYHIHTPNRTQPMSHSNRRPSTRGFIGAGLIGRPGVS